MPYRKKVQAHRTVTSNLEFRIYEDELRKILQLPARKDIFNEVTFGNGRLIVKFQKVSSNQFPI